MKILQAKQNNEDLEEILKGCRANKAHSQELLFKKFAPVVFSTCKRYGTKFYTAKDILQDTFISIFDKIHSFDPQKGSFHNWAIRIAINRALNVIRNQKISFVSTEPAIENIEDHTNLDDKIPIVSEDKILSLIEKLPLGYKTVFNLFVIDGYSHLEIAEILNISVQTSKSQLFKAKRKLQAQITDLKNKEYGEF